MRSARELAVFISCLHLQTKHVFVVKTLKPTKRFVRPSLNSLCKICEIGGICGSNFGIWVKST